MNELWLVAATVVTVSIPLMGATVGAFKGIDEMRLNRQKRVEEFRWRQAEMAKKILDETWSNEGARNAMSMLDWSGRNYDDRGRKTAHLTHDIVLRALDTQPRLYTLDEMFVRDSFDRFFEAASRAEHFVAIGLIHFGDVRDPWAYYVELMADAQVVLRPFMIKYKYMPALAFFRRFEAWCAKEGPAKAP